MYYRQKKQCVTRAPATPYSPTATRRPPGRPRPPTRRSCSSRSQMPIVRCFNHKSSVTYIYTHTLSKKIITPIENNYASTTRAPQCRTVIKMSTRTYLHNVWKNHNLPTARPWQRQLIDVLLNTNAPDPLKIKILCTVLTFAARAMLVSCACHGNFSELFRHGWPRSYIVRCFNQIVLHTGMI